MAVAFLELLGSTSEEDEVRGSLGVLEPRQREETELGRVMNRWEQEFLVLEAMQADQCSLLDQVLEKDLGCVVAGDTGRDDDADPPTGPL